MLSEHERYYGLSMDALVSVCYRNTNVIWFESGCFGQRMLSEHERYYGLSMDALVSVCSSEHERYYGLSMDALVSACSRNTNVIML